MTERLYYTDSYLTEFEASVMNIEKRGNNYFVLLDRTAFYPTSGGQLNDTGRIAGEKVVDVIEENGLILHVLSLQPSFKPGEEIVAEIDWIRRRDNMQKHTGQHILSQAFIQVCQAETVSARLGDEDSTVELNCGQLSQAQIDRVEELANQVIFKDLPVSIDFVPYEKLKDLPLRKVPDRQEGKFRIVRIGDFDWTACGGTHCRSTGSVGIIKIGGQEKIRGNLRFHFLTGLGALFDYRWRYDQIEAISNVFTRHGRETLEAVKDLLEENKQLRRKSSELRKELLPVLADKWIEQAREIEGYKIIAIDMTGDDFKTAKDTVSIVIDKYPSLVLAGADDKLVVGVAGSLSLNAAEILKNIATRYGGRGGGSPQLAQGGGFNAQDIKNLIAHPEMVLKI